MKKFREDAELTTSILLQHYTDHGTPRDFQLFMFGDCLYLTYDLKQFNNESKLGRLTVSKPNGCLGVLRAYWEVPVGSKSSYFLYR